MPAAARQTPCLTACPSHREPICRKTTPDPATSLVINMLLPSVPLLGFWGPMMLLEAGDGDAGAGAGALQLRCSQLLPAAIRVPSGCTAATHSLGCQLQHANIYTARHTLLPMF